jgi:hypothetical protein
MATHDAVGQVVAMCAANAPCHAKWPDLRSSIDQAIAKLDASPVSVTVAGSTGAPLTILFDGATLVRALRVMIGANDGAAISALPTTIGRVLAGTLQGDDPAAVLLASDPGACVGFWPACASVNLGSAYTLTCADFSASAGASGPAQIDGPGYAEAFGHDPFLAVCPSWGVTARPLEAQSGTVTAVPTLLVAGALDPYTGSPATVSRDLRSFSRGYLLEVPNVSYNALGWYECPRTIRGAWLDAPAGPPADTSCLATIPAPKIGQ